jgi:hypothetical protein
MNAANITFHTKCSVFRLKMNQTVKKNHSPKVLGKVEEFSKQSLQELDNQKTCEPKT